MISDEQIKEILPDILIQRFPRWGDIQTRLWDGIGPAYWDLTFEEQEETIDRARMLMATAQVMLFWSEEEESS